MSKNIFRKVGKVVLNYLAVCIYCKVEVVCIICGCCYVLTSI
jgi:hypothetical protein